MNYQRFLTAFGMTYAGCPELPSGYAGQGGNQRNRYCESITKALNSSRLADLLVQRFDGAGLAAHPEEGAFIVRAFLQYLAVRVDCAA
jgi:hypothetical protein